MKKIIDYLLCYLLIFCSGNRWFSNTDGQKTAIALIGICCLFVMIFNKYQKQYLKRLLGYCFVFLLIFLGQYLTLDFVSKPSILGFICKCIIGAFVIRQLNSKFVATYTNTMVFISAISLIVFIPVCLLHLFSLPDIIDRGFYVLDRSSNIYRNSGTFWEPGAFAGYIIIVFILNLPDLLKEIRLHKIKYAILFCALVTTFSTAGYLIIFVVLIFVMWENLRKHIVLFLVALSMFIPLSFYIYNNTEFLSDKIESQVEFAVDNRGEKFEPTRFNALMFDIHYIKKHPFFGNGFHERTRYADHPMLWGEKLGHGNGFSNFAASMGLTGLVFYLIMLYRGIPFKRKDKICFLAVVVLLLQSEQYLNFPLFLSLPFLFCTFKNKE